MVIYKIEHFENDLSQFKLSETEMELMETFEINEVVLEDNGKCVIGLFTTNYMEFVKNLFEAHGIKFSITDVTEEYTKTTPLFDQFMNKYSAHKNEITAFIKANTTVDDVLDKISKFGVESLNEIDKQILN